jgi:hypothetical protein
VGRGHDDRPVNDIDADIVRLDFPLHAVERHPDRVVVLLDRDSLPKLRSFIAALELGLIEVRDVRGAGHG